MLFRSFYKGFFLAVLVLDFMDYTITQVGFSRYPVWFEANPYIRLLMTRGFDPHLASTIVLLTSLAFIVGSYYLLKEYLAHEPYTQDLKHVGKYLWNLSTIKARDLSIFACLALAIVLAVQHLQGFISWLRLLL
jgi:hypothetical protein